MVRLWGGGGLLQKEKSPDFRSPEVGISAIARYEKATGVLFSAILTHLSVNFGVRQPRSQGLSSPHPKGSEGRKTLVQAGHMSW